MYRILTSLLTLQIAVGVAYAGVLSKKITPLPQWATAIATSDGGILLSVRRGIVKMDTTGSVIWQRGLDVSPSMLAEYPGGYLAGDDDVLYALDRSGTLLWAKTFDFSPSYSYTYVRNAFGVAGRILVWFGIYSVADSRYVSSLVALDSTGNVLWGKTYGLTLHDVTLGSGYMYVAAADSLDTLVVVKLDLSGNVIWAKKYGRYVYGGFKTVGISTLGSSLVVASTNRDILRISSSDGSVIWAKQGSVGFSNVSTDSSFIYLTKYQIAKLDSLGNPIWSKDYDVDTTRNAIFEYSHVAYGYLLAYGDMGSGSDTAYLIRVPTSDGALSCATDYPISPYDVSVTPVSYTLTPGTVTPTATAGPSTTSVSVGIHDACVAVGVGEESSSPLCPEVGVVYDASGRRVRLGERKGVFFLRTKEGVRKVMVR